MDYQKLCSYLSPEHIHKLQFLMQVTIFHNLDFDFLEKLLLVTKQQTFIRNQSIYTYNDNDQALYIIKNGEIHIYEQIFYNSKEYKIKVVSLNQTQYFGEQEYFQQLNFRKSNAIVASDSAELLIIYKSDFYVLLKNQQFYKQLSSLFNKKYKIRQLNLKNLVKLKQIQLKINKNTSQSLSVTPRKQQQNVKISQTMRTPGKEKDSDKLKGSLKKAFQQTLNIKNLTDFYKKYQREPQKSENVFWIMDRKTFITGIDKIEYKVYPPCFKIQNDKQKKKNFNKFSNLSFSQQADSVNQKEKLYNSFFHDKSIRIYDKEQIKRKNQDQIRKYIKHSEKIFNVQDNKPTKGFQIQYQLPDIENRLKNNYSRSAKNQFAFDSEKQLLDSIEKKRTKSRITGYLYKKDNNSP